MKWVLFNILLFICFYSFGQENILIGTWNKCEGDTMYYEVHFFDNYLVSVSGIEEFVMGPISLNYDIINDSTFIYYSGKIGFASNDIDTTYFTQTNEGIYMTYLSWNKENPNFNYQAPENQEELYNIYKTYSLHQFDSAFINRSYKYKCQTKPKD